MAHQSTELECPRCGHLLGALADDSERRGEPGGNCSECGLEVEWSALRESGSDPRWFVESRGTRRWIATRAAATLVRTLRPFAFWSRLRMNIGLRWQGLAAFIVAVAIAAHFVGAAARISINADRMQRRFSADLTVADYAWAVASPASAVAGSQLLEELQGGARVQSFPAATPGAQRRPWTIGESAGIALSAALTTGLVEGDMGAWWTGSSPGFRARMPRLVDSLALGRLAAAALVPWLAPMALLLVPTSLRMAKVRVSHLVRGSIYASALLLPLFALAIIAFHLRWPLAIGAPTPTGRLAPHVLTLTAAGLALVWMGALCRCYLRLRQPWSVALACTAIATLLSLFVSSLWFGLL